MAILRNDTTVRSADGQTTSAIITAANIGNYGISTTSTYYIGTTQNVFNRASGAQTLTGVSIDGNAATVTNGVYTTGTQSISGAKTFNDASTFGSNVTLTGASQLFIGSYMSLQSSVSIMGMVGFNRKVSDGTIFNSSYAAYQLHNDTGTLNLQIYTSAGGFVGAHTFNSSGNITFIGSTTSSTDLRAPVFYDTNNTAYYCDPASVSNLNAVTLNRSGSDGYLTLPGSVTVSNVSGAEMVIRGLSQLRFSNSTSWDWNSWAGLRYDNAGTTIYLGGPAATGIFTQNATPPTVTVSFVGTNNVTSDSNFKAPIFYDSANTAYYLDPANTGTSLLVAGNVGIGTTSPGYILDVRGDIRIGNGTSGEQDIRFVSLNGDWQVGTNNGGNGTNNNQFYFYDNAYRLTIQTGTGNVGIGTTSPSYILDANSTNDNAIRIRNGAGSANNGLALSVGSGSPWLDIIEGVEFRIKGNTYANIGTWNSGNNTKLLINSSGNVGIGTTSPSQKLHVVGTGFASTDFRAPIFYDSDNTVYYIDPASTSNINVLTVNGNTSLQKFTIGNRNLIYSYYHGGAQDLAWKKIADVLLPNSLYSAASFKVNVVDAQGNFGWNTDCRDLTYFISCRRSGGVLNDYDDAVLAGPINDYIRIVKTSQGVYELQIRQIQDWQNLYFQFELISGGAGYVTYVSGTPANGSTTGTIYTVNTANANGYTQYYPVVSASASIRSPIFYDSNDTNYYVDAASTSKLSIVSTSRINALDGTFLFKSGSGSGTTRHINLADSTADPSSVGSATGITVGERSDNTAYYMIYVKAPYNNGSSTHSRLVLGWHTGMEIGANATYGGVRFMTDSPGVSTSEIFSVGKTDANVRVANTIFAQTFSDSNNTSYYLDPASTSVLNALTVGGNNVLTTASTLTAGNLSGTIPSAVLGNSTLYVGTTAIALNRGSASQTLTGISIDGNAATASNATQFGGEANTNFMRGLAGGTEANINNYTDNGFRTVAYTGHGKGLLSFNVGSSIGTVQHEYFYNIPTNGWRVRNKTDNTTWSSWGNIVMTDTNQGALTGTVITTGNSSGLSPTFSNLYAAIFYDAADSTYYLDPANTTLSLKTRSSIIINNASAPQNLAMLNIGYNGAGETRAIDIYGSWSGGENKSITFNHASTTSDIVAQINAQHNGPGSRLRWGKLYHGGNSSTYTMELISESTTSAYLTVAGSVRAPIFYDSNDTTYYLDPAAATSLNIAGQITTAKTSGTLLSIAGADTIGYNATASRGAYIKGTSTTYVYGSGVYYDGSSVRQMLYEDTWLNSKYFDSNGIIYSQTSMRAPIFYDYNDTSYYVDPASTSIMLYVRAANFYDGTGTYNVNLGSGNSEGRGLVAGYSGGSYGGIGYNVRHTTTGGSWIAPSTDTSTYLLFSNGVYFYYAAGGAAGRTLSYSTIGSLTSAGIFTVSGDVRAPLFYDSNNTAYYLDPASTSNLNVLNAVSSTTLWVRSGSWAGDLTSNGFTREIGMQMTGGSEFVILSKSGQGYTLVDGSYYAYEAGGFYSSFNSSYGAIVGFSADSTSSVTFNCNVKAPIYYDSNNTSYYLDPNSASNLNNVTVAGTLTLTNIAKNSTAPIVINSGQSASLGLRVYYDMNLYNTLTFTDSAWNSQGSIFGSSSVVTINAATATTSFVKYAGYSQEGGSFRAPIFYDSNDTNYYVDPNGNSVLNGLYVNAYYNLANNYKDIYVYGDVNTYYVVLIQGEYLYSYGRYSVTRGYNWTGPDTWYTSTHKGGLTLDWEYSGDTAWGGNDQNIRIIEFYETYSTMVAGFALPVNGGVIVWLRGGGVNGALYRIRTPIGANSTVTVYDGITATNHSSSTSFTAANSAVFSTRANTSNVASEINSRFPVRYAGTLYNDGNAVLDQSGTSQTKSGILSSAASLRAPIFYDTDNTGYYIDPNGASSINTITSAQYYTTGWFRNNSSGNGLYNESTGQHFYSDSANYWNVASSAGAQGIRLRTGGHNGTVRGYFYADTNNDVGFLNQDGNWRLRVVGGDYALADGSSMRAQIFYDSNDTNYYVDPAGTSYLNYSIFNGLSSADYTRQFAPSGGYFYAGGAQTGAIKIRMPANSKALYPMLSFTCHIYNYSTGTSRTFKIGGHFSNSSWYNPFAYCLSESAGNLNVRWGYEGNYLVVWIGETSSGWSYPCVFITDFQNGYSAINNSWMTGWNVSLVTAFDTVTNGPTAAGFFWNQNNDGSGSGLDADLLDGINSASFLRSDVSATNSVDLRSPIFYDSSNTAYYLDPASQSKLYNLLIETGGVNTSMTIVGSNQPSIFLKTTDNQRNIEIFNSYGNFGIYRSNAPSNYIIYHVDNGASSSTEMQLQGTARLTINSNGLTATTSVRSPIFFDSDNTAYYIDGASGSKLKYLQIDGDWGSSPFGSGSETFTIRSTYASFCQRQTNGNLGYWLHHIPTDGSYMLYGGRGATDGTSWDWSLRAFPNQDGSYVEFRTSARAPIFYDRDNTSYYVDPASTSNLNIISTAGYQYINGQTINGQSFYQWEGAAYRNPADHTPQLLIRKDNATTGLNGFAPALALYNNNGLNQSTVGMVFVSAEAVSPTQGNAVELGGIIAKKEAAGTAGSWTQGSLNFFVKAYATRVDAMSISESGSITSYIDTRSPIFYDSNNTGYYCDPASTSILNLVRTRNTFGERITVTSAASTTIDTNFNVTELTMSASITTLTLSNIQASTIVHMWTIVTVGNGTAYSITWPAAIKWPGGTAPTITSTNAKRDIYQFVTYDGGTNIYAIIVGQNL